MVVDTGFDGVAALAAAGGSGLGPQVGLARFGVAKLLSQYAVIVDGVSGNSCDLLCGDGEFLSGLSLLG